MYLRRSNSGTHLSSGVHRDEVLCAELECSDPSMLGVSWRRPTDDLVQVVFAAF